MWFRRGESFTERAIREAPDSTVGLARRESRRCGGEHLLKVALDHRDKGEVIFTAAAIRALYGRRKLREEELVGAALILAEASRRESERESERGYLWDAEKAERKAGRFARDAGSQRQRFGRF